MYVNTLPGSGLDTRKMPIALFISELSASAPFPGNLAVSAPPSPAPQRNADLSHFSSLVLAPRG